MKIDVYKGSLKSFSKKKLEQAEAKSLRPRTKPDADNYAKGPLDACKGILWKDDGQVVDLFVSKYYSKNPRIEIRIQEVDSIQETLF